MKLDQIAFYASTEEEAWQIKRMLGLHNAVWIEDMVTADSIVYDFNPLKIINVGQLRFNYDMGVELEILTYREGTHWHMLTNPLWNKDWGNGQRFISHVGFHLEDGEDFPNVPGARLVQETWTKEHTNAYIVEIGRKYHYKIYEVTPGTYVKYIKRIHKGE